MIAGLSNFDILNFIGVVPVCRLFNHQVGLNSNNRERVKSQQKEGSWSFNFNG